MVVLAIKGDMRGLNCWNVPDKKEGYVSCKYAFSHTIFYQFASVHILDLGIECRNEWMIDFGIF